MKPLTLLEGDWIARLRELPDAIVQCCVTSPPYWGLRDYNLPPSDWPAMSYVPMSGCGAVAVPAWSGCLGLEPSPEIFLAHVVYGFREVRRVLRRDGTLWMNWGDSYANDTKWGGQTGGKHVAALHGEPIGRGKRNTGLKPKDLCGIPWRVAFALQAAGWFLRSDIIWHKPNPMPESVTDRPTKSHEYIFLLTKQADYFCDMEAIKEGSSANTHARVPGNVRPPKGQNTYENGDERHRTKAGLLNFAQRKQAEVGSGTKNNPSFNEACCVMLPTRNSRTVWTITTEPFKGAHFATFPTEIPRRAILAGTSARGACADCGAPWERRLEPDEKRAALLGQGQHDHENDDQVGQRIEGAARKNDIGGYVTAGWQPSCTCHGHFALAEVVIPARITKDDASALWGADSNGEYLGLSTKNHTAAGVQDASAIKQRIIQNATTDRTVTRKVYRSDIPLDQHPVKPCLVLDPFGGSGTTSQVALELGRHAILIELNPEYLTLIRERCDITPGLPLA